MSDQADLNNVLDDINGISVCLMEARDEFKELYPLRAIRAAPLSLKS